MISIHKNFENVPKDFKSELTEIYNDKCGYCESKRTNASLEIEHYRPKSKYTWLIKDWSNLLLACRDCNSAKKANFPILGTFIENKNDWDLIENHNNIEKPFLLNPEIDEPEKYFIFNFDGTISTIDFDKKRSEKTLEICKLNREILIKLRKQKIDDLFKELNHLITLQLMIGLEKYKDIINFKTNPFFEKFNKIIENSNNKAEFSRVYYFFFENFETYLTESQIIKNDKCKILILNAFKTFIEKNN